MLTRLDIRNLPTEQPSQEIKEEGIFAVAGWSVITIEPFLSWKGEEVGSTVYVEHRGPITVRELMVDVIGRVEQDVSEDKDKVDSNGWPL